MMVEQQISLKLTETPSSGMFESVAVMNIYPKTDKLGPKYSIVVFWGQSRCHSAGSRQPL